ncbi:RNA-guided endonuclease IscB [Ktedonobacter racemifer]|uniref:HNH endonuclease n=1 Tax=Ktedonobacter racemifer DSM 44963 TaxID=485913 RepID=D6TF81_KTERA|nr:RNA-guided endonuclease IscB [Ktedonobacter racemifer]EFH90481.1 HNH endonuclease [Ktedonobacter racemifer DSM 44963]
MNRVYVLSSDRTPLMPCSSVIARLLLKEGKAKVVRRTPFTIKLYVQPEHPSTQPLTLGVDTGSTVIGSAVASEQNDIVYLSEVEARNDIATAMKERAAYRRKRRSRKIRYRPARWLNRRNSIKRGRFSPTMRSKIDAHLREIRFVQSILPITSIVLETSTFDPHALKNPEVLRKKWLYQKGINYGYANTRAYVLTRDGYTCQHCKGKTKEQRLEVHHLIFRRHHGSDEESNLLTLCKTCHDALHAGTITLKCTGKKKGKLLHATQMSSIRMQLLKRVEAEETWGFVTKEHRLLASLPKEHCFDAAMIATRGQRPVIQIQTVLVKKCIPDGDYQQTKGKRSEQRLTTGKIEGFRKFDKVRYRGQEYFIKGRMSTGYAILMMIDGKKVDLKPIPKLEKMKRVSARSSWMIDQRSMPRSIGNASQETPRQDIESQGEKEGTALIHEAEDLVVFLPHQV